MIRGIGGYVAPELVENAPVSAKVDVSVLGVMLTGNHLLSENTSNNLHGFHLRGFCFRIGKLNKHIRIFSLLFHLGSTKYLERTYDCYVEGRLDALIDSDEAAMADRSRLHKWLMIAMWCIQEDPSKRPTMKVVMQMLEGLLEVPNPPWSSSFSIAVTES
ncbi:hypothetical protein CUMW_075850 [Citrus unshiu]|nr:hypothetical protein CUMW_075850 [Citrus unshiu]